MEEPHGGGEQLQRVATEVAGERVAVEEALQQHVDLAGNGRGVLDDVLQMVRHALQQERFVLTQRELRVRSEER